MRLYRKYFIRYKAPFITAVLCVALEAVCDLLGPTLMSHIVSGGIEKGSLTEVYYWGALMLAVTLTGAVFAVARNYLSSYVSQRMGADLRADLFEKILSFSEDSADKITGASLITRMTNDTSQIVQFVNGMMRIFLKAPILCAGSIVLAGLLNFRLSLVIYGVVAAVTLFVYISMKLSYPRFERLQKAVDQVNSIVQEYLIGVRLVKAFGTYGKEREKFEEANVTLMQKAISAQLPVTVASPFLTLAVGAGTAAAIFAGSKLFTVNLADIGDMTAFTIYMAQILTSLIMITNVFTMFVRTRASTARIGQVLAGEEDFAKSGEKRRLQGNIRFKNVSFAYPNGSGAPVIKGLSFSVSRGETLAVIGPTGSGKSTIAWLLLRFYGIKDGQILLDGHPIEKLGADEIRDNIAIVPQRPMLFSGSVAENLRWGDRQASLEQLEKAAERAQGAFILQMPDQYDSFLGSEGVNLSGGQKQRISIARGMLKNAPILILDDATSALDAITEAKVREKLRTEDNPDQTVIIITQRCGTAMSADHILVMESGRKAGFGTHEELIRDCRVYQDIYRTQIENVRGA